MNILGIFIKQASNIWLGIVAAIVVIAVIYLIIYVLQGGNKKFTPLSYLIAVPLLPLLAIQLFLLFGSISLKHTCSEVASWIDVLVPEKSTDGSFSREDINDAVSQAVAAFPVAATLIDAELITQDEDMTLGEALTHKVHVYLNWYIVRRVAWSMCFIAVAILGISILMEHTKGRGVQIRRGTVSRRGNHTLSQGRSDERLRRNSRRR
ncbi:MAG: hypothetical protein IJ700_02770 [Bacteroidaceae bacterium]|nr:hypothetical protein [Bacteroidaceae bacterium]